MVASAAALWVPTRAEVIYINHDPTGGDEEIGGEHPMLVISTREFNEKTGLVIGFPMTHSERHQDNPFAVVVRKNTSGQTSYILALQPKSFDWRARGARPHPWGTGFHTDLKEALITLNEICGVSDAVNG